MHKQNFENTSRSDVGNPSSTSETREQYRPKDYNGGDAKRGNQENPTRYDHLTSLHLTKDLNNQQIKEILQREFNVAQDLVKIGSKKPQKQSYWSRQVENYEAAQQLLESLLKQQGDLKDQYFNFIKSRATETESPLTQFIQANELPIHNPDVADALMHAIQEANP